MTRGLIWGSMWMTLRREVRMRKGIFMVQWFGFAALGFAISCCCAAEPVVFYGASDASAAAVLDGEHFVVADDENNMLRIYRFDRPSGPVGTVEMGSFLQVEPEYPEADIEGAARAGERIYWITSHGRNKDGKERPNRYAFFATDIVKGEDESLTLNPVGRPYRRLAYDLMLNPRLLFLELEKVIGLGGSMTKAQREALAPKDEGLNIEGLAAGADGSLYIGLRNPVYRDPVRKKNMAIVLVLRNPEAMVMDSRSAEFGTPVLLDLDGLGVRSIERITAASGEATYLIAAGTANGKNRFAFYRWSGAGTDVTPVAVAMPADFTPEALFQIAGTDSIWMLSDDGTVEKTVAGADECLPGELLKNGSCPNKFLTDVNRRTFRGLRLLMKNGTPQVSYR